MASHKPNLDDWMLDLVSGIDKLHVLAESSIDDLECWEDGLFKVLSSHGIASYVSEESKKADSWGEQNATFKPWSIRKSFPILKKAPALNLLNLTLDDSVERKLSNNLGGIGCEDPRFVYFIICERYMDGLRR